MASTVFPSATQAWHNDTYASISPSRPEFNCKDKTVIITGGGSGIGLETALAYAAAGATRIILLGRTLSKLQAAQRTLSATTRCHVYAADVIDEERLNQVANEIGVWDILILNAGTLSNPNPLGQADTADWWHTFETNVKGTLIAVKAFLPTARPEQASVVGVTSAFTLPTATFNGLSAYIASKTAQAKMFEFLAYENPRLFVASVQPGFIDTEIFRKGGGETGMDTVQLPAHFIVWLTSPEGAFLKGRSVWANWDVDELKQRASAIQQGQEFMVGIFGWDKYLPYPR